MAEPSQFHYSYRDLRKLSGLPANAVYRHTARGTLDPSNLGSVVVWLARHARPALQRRIVGAALRRELDD